MNDDCCLHGLTVENCSERVPCLRCVYNIMRAASIASKNCTQTQCIMIIILLLRNSEMNPFRPIAN